jgi:major type 1 subunit fimbrin (pilin)
MKGIRMNKTLLSAAMIAGFGVAAFAPQTARAVDGTITINGKITSSTCTINAPGGASFTVTLPTVATTALSTTGAVAGTTPFALTLTACTFATAGNVSTYFEPSAANILADGNLKNTAATNGVEVRLLNSASTPLALNGLSGSQNASTAAVTTTSTGATLNYFAQYFAASTVTAGAVAAQVTYSVTYP